MEHNKVTERLPDAIVILSGCIKRIGDTWQSTDLSEVDAVYGSPGQSLRVEAATILAHKYPRALLVPSGGIGYEHPQGIEPEKPLLAEVMHRELLKHSIQSSRIFPEAKSNSTYQQLQALEHMLSERAWEHVIIVTSRWHVPRVGAMIEAEFSELANRVILVSAEEVLIADSPQKWQALIEDAYHSEFLKERIEKENEGIRQIKSGTYRFR